MSYKSLPYIRKILRFTGRSYPLNTSLDFHKVISKMVSKGTSVDRRKKKVREKGYSVREKKSKDRGKKEEETD